MIKMEALKRYGGALAIAAVPSATGGGLSYLLHNVFQGSHVYMNQSANFMGDATLIAGIGIGVIGGVAHAISYRSRTQQTQNAPQAGNPPQVPAQGGQGNQDIHIHFHNHP
ncbi:MAG: hypothetical protein HY831_01810 [Candidatus Aenigmarchaeota archaeon]|nr:hypothetical protein [Candidatus Aenigmarchaeota archaeon]